MMNYWITYILINMWVLLENIEEEQCVTDITLSSSHINRLNLETKHMAYTLNIMGPLIKRI